MQNDAFINITYIYFSIIYQPTTEKHQFKLHSQKT